MLSLKNSLKVLKKTNALLEGHFILSSGLHSAHYVQCAKLLSYTKLSEKFVFLVIATIPASKYFDDGRNIHLCLKTKNEWNSIFLKYKKKYPNINQYIFFDDKS